MDMFVFEKGICKLLHEGGSEIRIYGLEEKSHELH